MQRAPRPGPREERKPISEDDMQAARFLSTAVLSFLLGSSIAVFAQQQEERRDEAKPPRPEEPRREEAKPPRQDEAKPPRQEEAKPPRESATRTPRRQECSHPRRKVPCQFRPAAHFRRQPSGRCPRTAAVHLPRLHVCVRGSVAG